MTGWGTDAILRELAGAAQGFDIALATLADAADYAERAAARVAALPGMARGIRGLKQAIGDRPTVVVWVVNTSVA